MEAVLDAMDAMPDAPATDAAPVVSVSPPRRAEITRGELKDICELTITRSPGLSDEWRAKLREVAATATRIAGGYQWWDDEMGAGCLVGTALGGPAVFGRWPVPSAVQHAGTQFVKASDEVIGPRKYWLTVVD